MSGDGDTGANEPEAMIEDLLSKSFGQIRRARSAVDNLRTGSWVVLGFGLLGVVGLVLDGIDNSNPGQVFAGGAALLALLVPVALLTALASHLELTATRLELEVWQSELFED